MRKSARVQRWIWNGLHQERGYEDGSYDEDAADYYRRSRYTDYDEPYGYSRSRRGDYDYPNDRDYDRRDGNSDYDYDDTDYEDDYYDRRETSSRRNGGRGFASIPHEEVSGRAPHGGGRNRREVTMEIQGEVAGDFLPWFKR